MVRHVNQASVFPFGEHRERSEHFAEIDAEKTEMLMVRLGVSQEVQHAFACLISARSLCNTWKN